MMHTSLHSYIGPRIGEVTFAEQKIGYRGRVNEVREIPATGQEGKSHSEQKTLNGQLCTEYL
jgi:hypothetical protein